MGSEPSQQGRLCGRHVHHCPVGYHSYCGQLIRHHSRRFLLSAWLRRAGRRHFAGRPEPGRRAQGSGKEHQLALTRLRSRNDDCPGSADVRLCPADNGLAEPGWRRYRVGCEVSQDRGLGRAAVRREHSGLRLLRGRRGHPGAFHYQFHEHVGDPSGTGPAAHTAFRPCRILDRNGR